MSIYEIQTDLRRRATIQRIGVGLMLFFVFAMVAAFIYYLVFLPSRTPLLAVAATDYATPVALNPWAAEDLASLQKLDENSIRFSDATSEFRTKDQAVATLKSELASFARRVSRKGAVVVYLSMHGLVDSHGKPYLLPALANPLDSTTWLSVEETLDTIQAALPPRVNKLVVLDSNRMATNWSVGQLYNTFADRLPEVVTKEAYPNLIVLNSASPDQVAWTAPARRATAFGSFFRLGLAGEADLESDDVEGGNGDRQVSVQELHGYLTRSLAAWSGANRASLQAPLLLPAGAEDFEITWVVNDRTLQELRDETQVAAPAVSIPPAEMDRLWQRWETLDDDGFRQLAPLRYQEVRAGLLRLEALSEGGGAYAVEAEKRHRELSRELAALAAAPSTDAAPADGIPADGRGVSLVGRWQARSRGAAAPMAIDGLPSRELATLWGSLDTARGEELQQSFERLTLDANRAELDGASKVFRSSPSHLYADGYFLELLRRYSTLEQWQRRDVIGKTLELKARSARLAVLRSDRRRLGDPRLLRWMSPSLDLADGNRREVEDLLLLGQRHGAERFDRRYEEAVKSFDAAEDRLARLLEVQTLADQVACDAPHYARWLTRLHAREDAAVNETLIPLIMESRALAHALETLPATAADNAPAALPMLAAKDRLAELLQATSGMFAAEIKRLADLEKPTPQACADLDAVLSLPLVPWKSRRDLRALRAKFEQQLAAAVGRAPSLGGADLSGESEERLAPAAIGYHDRWQSWSDHPALAVCGLSQRRLQADAQTALDEGSVARIEQLGYFVREALTPWAADGESAGVVQAADALAQEASQQRAVSALAFKRQKTSPIDGKLRLDLQRLLLWHARRGLDDFYGPLPAPALGESGTAPARRGAEMFFDAACRQCLAAVQRLGTPAPAEQNEVDSIERLLAARRLAAREAISTHASNSAFLAEGQAIELGVTVAPDADRASAKMLPKGVASVWIQPADAAPIAPPQAVAVPFEQPADVAIEIPGDAAQTLDPVLDAVAMFRGNEYRQNFLINRIGGVAVSYRPHRYGPSKITIFGQRTERASIVFILDCSRSMNDPLPSESANDEPSSRLDLAKTALAQMIDELSRNEETRIGVRFFGHRVAWTRSNPPERKPSPYFTGIAPVGLEPSEDVEVVSSLGRFEGEKVFQRLDEVQPWGQSPLYLAIRQALEDFASDDPDTDKSIVVITDGRNYQYAPSRSDVAVSRFTDLGQVVNATAQARIPVYILGFGLESAERQQAEQDFRAIATASGGATKTVNDAVSLADELRARLGLGSFAVERSRPPAAGQAAAGRAAASGDGVIGARLNGTVEVPASALDDEGHVRLQFESLEERIKLAGGEALQLQLSSDGKRLLPVPFSGRFPERAYLVDAAGKRNGVVFRAHRPSATPQGVNFALSLQADNKLVTERPVESWLTVTPLVDGVEDTERTYTFYDANYEPGQPVPLLEWQAPDWPLSAREANLRYWCRMSATPVIRAIPLTDVAAAPGSFVDYALKELPRVRLQILLLHPRESGGSFVVSVMEHHVQGNDVASLRVGMDLPDDIRPTRVTHRFDKKHSIASHLFEFEAAEGRLLERSPQAAVTLTTRAAMQAGSLRLEDDQPLNVKIFAPGDLLLDGNRK